MGLNLIKKLIESDYQVKALVRTEKEKQLLQGMGIKAPIGDILSLDSFLDKLEDNSIIFYLIHGLGRQKEKGEPLKIEEKAVDNLVEAARIKKASRIIHLTGIFSEEQKLSSHLLARKLTSEKIKNSGIPYTILRASIIFGKGSISFGIIKAMLFKMPLIPLLKWRRSKISPIHINDVIFTLIKTLENPSFSNRVIDIGGPEIFTYEDFFKKLSQFLGLKRVFFKFPFNLFRLSAFFTAKLTGFPQREVYFLFQSLKNDCYCGPDQTEKFFNIKPKSIFDKKLFA